MLRFRRNSRDKILDACLSEVVGGKRPPDLSDRILRNLGNRKGRRRRRGGAFLLLAVAACLMLVAVGFLAAKLANSSRTPGGNLAGADDSGRSDSGVSDSGKSDSGKVADGGAVIPRLGKQPDPPQPTPKDPQVKPRTGPDKTVVVKNDPGPTPKSTPPKKKQPPDVRTLVATAEPEIIKAVNTGIHRRWQDEGVTPAAHATDAEWCRRVYLDLLGRIPTYEESLAFTSDRSADRKEKLVDHLMNSEDYVEEFSRNWTTIWTNLLLGRDEDDRNGAVNREGFQQFVRRAFLTNKPYDEMVYELLTASGSNKPGDEDFHGAVSFLLDNLDENATAATAKTARIFLGVQVQCTQCHNHPFNDRKQAQFWQLNAFFRQAKMQRGRGNGNGRSARLTDVTFAGDLNDPDEPGVFFELRNGLMQVAYPTFLDGTKINPSGRVEVVNRRQELAKLLVKSDDFSKAIVNRIWGHFLGYGFTQPVDDMGPHKEVSHPDELALLAKEFVAHRHDLRKLFRWVTLSEPYALSSRAAPLPGGRKKGTRNIDDPEAGNTPLFARFYMRQMRAEELYESLLVATHAEQAGGNFGRSFAEQQRRKDRWLQQFTMAYDNDENDEATTFNGTISQTLMMWNGRMISTATAGGRGTFLQKIAASKEKPSTKINQLFLAALGRRPTKGEINMANQLWRARQGDTTAALQDIWWVLLNSGEFILNH